MRLFSAVDLSDDAREAIAAEQTRLASAFSRSRSSLKLVRPAQMHLTLVFLGDLDDARVPVLVEAMNAGIDLPAFDAAFVGAGAFPPRGAPRVLWIGVGAGAADLISLRARVASTIRGLGLGIAVDDRPFQPHLTIARWRDSRPADRAKLPRPSSREIVRMHVEQVTLYQSQLSPSGSRYTALAHATLGAKDTASTGESGD
jgi:2'-5' RNA ligase